jgi:hypothetical protein
MRPVARFAAFYAACFRIARGSALRAVLLCALALPLLAACAQYAPVPGGSDAVNSTFYKSDDDLKKIIDRLQVGMTQKQVFDTLGHPASTFPKMSREELVSALYGGNNADFSGTLRDQELARNFLNSLSGYRLEFANVKRRHGFSSPIRVRTMEKGFDYTANLIFQNGYLFEKPMLSGGPVNKVSSRTLFDYLNPLTIVTKGELY